MSSARGNSPGFKAIGKLLAIGSKSGEFFNSHVVHRLKPTAYVLLSLWLLWSLAGLLWSFLPEPEIQGAQAAITNAGGNTSSVSDSVNIEQLLSWQMFGQSPIAEDAMSVETQLSGIEANASDTKLQLILRGIMSSDEDEGARAMIETGGDQKQYAIGDKLPVTGRVVIAKILPDRVVLDNGGRYELLRLFEAKGLGQQLLQAEPEQRFVDQRGDIEITQLAEGYRKRLYSSPKTLSDVVKITAQRSNGQMLGYKVSPGKDKEQFNRLGFKNNDIVTAVNGIVLDDPGKAIELYRVMRSAQDASFTVLRDAGEINLVVGLGQ